jgi:formylglycine-generating enzyme required for sulfatase activity
MIATRTISIVLALLILGVLCHKVGADTFGSGANQFVIEFVPIGNPGNAADTASDPFPPAPNPAGSVEYAYRMGKYEISKAMIDKATASGMTNVTTVPWTAAQPAADVSWYEAAAFVNWLNTSEGHQTAYDLTWTGSAWSMALWSSADAWQKGGENRFRHKDAHYFLPSADEWYKAAYYDPNAGVYYNYPTGSDSVPDGIDFAGDTTFDAVFDDGGFNPQPNDITDVGVLSPYGTAGQGGNVLEWEETEFDLVNDSSSSSRGLRGGNWGGISGDLRATLRHGSDPSYESSFRGFRVASIPEPTTYALALAALCLVLGRRRAC